MLAHNGIIILLTLLLSLIAAIMPMPITLDTFRPDWVLVVTMYWAIALPSRVNVITAWVMGLLLDILLGSTLGVHAAAMATTIFIASGNFQKIRNFSLWQQSLVVGVLASLFHLIVFWLQRFLTDVVFLPSYLYPVLTSMVLWPWAFLLLRKTRQHFKIK
ncbi:rod shape-determining protein MreD [Thalassotalea eurytherma]|mgnify:FL=1|uniref:Rod shape-determining protein MreD n=1 Tax=Thalassotalea eurytherma TaxID=1144278 RepID=A0ABQ6HA64_9GAMM|nr:rod shape-determining protein MreD [Thalassotalea eurytherma]GLX83346.1 rod shape-determining protein MreD [Thalassotalea eurytherma]